MRYIDKGADLDLVDCCFPLYMNLLYLSVVHSNFILIRTLQAKRCINKYLWEFLKFDV